MTTNNKRMIITSVVLAVSVILLILFMFLGLNLGIFRIPSISYLISQYDLVKKEEKELSTAQDKYYSTLDNLKNAQTEFNKEKNKYNSISDETINVIKEATTEETYNIEYMWIKLGNYAKKNNLEIVIVEPGGTTTDKVSSSSNSTSNTNNTNNTENTTSTSNNVTTATNNVTTNNVTTNNSNTKNDSSTSNNTNTTDSILRVDVTGNYMNVSDFIFEVENDTTLRFKLDNISMEYVKDSLIKTSFDVKNITVNK